LYVLAIFDNSGFGPVEFTVEIQSLSPDVHSGHKEAGSEPTTRALNEIPFSSYLEQRLSSLVGGRDLGKKEWNELGKKEVLPTER